MATVPANKKLFYGNEIRDFSLVMLIEFMTQGN
jgi:hypothetical protein